MAGARDPQLRRAGSPILARQLGFVAALLIALGAPLQLAAATEARPLSPEERSDLLKRYEKALQTELGLLKTLDELDQRADKLDGQIVRLSVDLAQATDAMHLAERQRAKAQADLEQMRATVQLRLRAILRIAQLPTLRFALSHQDFSRSVAKDRLLRRMLAADRLRLQKYGDQLKSLEKLTAERDRALKKLQQLDLDLHAEKARGEQERRDKQALLAELDSDRRLHERAARDQDAAHRALSEQIAALAEWSERKYTFAMVQGKLLPPIQGRVEVGFGDLRHPRFGTVTLHRGLDLRGGSGPDQPVRAVFWGKVAFVGWLTGYGETVILDHGRGWHSVYGHLENTKAELGELVKARQRIADIGQSGSLKGRYLYFEIRHNGQPVDPAEWLR